MEEEKQLARPVGRQIFDGRNQEEVLDKLKQAWNWGATDTEAAAFAEISNSSLSRYIKANQDIAELRDRLKQKPVLKARKTVVDKLDESYNNAMDYLSRKKKAEFATRTETTGADGEPLTGVTIVFKDTKVVVEDTKEKDDGTD